MRRLALLAALLAVALSAPPASAMCPVPGVYAHRDSARPGEVVTVSVLGGAGHICGDHPRAPGTPPDPVVRVRLWMENARERVALATFWQRSWGHDVDVRIPPATSPGPWRFVTSTMRGDRLFYVTAPETLPRTGGAAPALTALGGWLVAAGGYAVSASGARRPRVAGG